MLSAIFPQALQSQLNTTVHLNWTREYCGYLISEGRRSKHASFKCVDEDMDILQENLDDTECGLFYHVEANFNGLLPYNDHQTQLYCEIIFVFNV